MKKTRSLRLLLTGFFMGMADLIPGVSGGTVAFISGIYEELLESIKNVSSNVPRLLLKRKFISAFKTVPYEFLVPLFLGIFAAIISLSRLLSSLIQNYPTYIWSFFFGLVLASTWLVAKRIKSWNLKYFTCFIIGTLIGYFIVGQVPGTTPETLPMFFLSGALAIIAMILPGISGSFILLIIGKYAQILEAAKELNFVVLVTVMFGAVFGLALFSRVLSWLFSKHHNISVAILSGFMLGSVRKLWPWKEVLLTRMNSHGEIVPLIEKNILPNSFGLEVLFAIALMIVGVGIIVWIDRLKLD
ncbi:DUF368 domain-containing protein [Candidatus Roizmanbacteria bacterium CG11_big_fil_rev_8_21_14_0_20_36_8]|uniref:DUF368 domain-containing protein n=2 Tax=Candidatus Roizmaniibacteriota TaxID=1752723 RepID=A0A2M6IVL2_9BACT|nr:MAG: DUF368 domain-containing protein [Candidatus Roizmanbacteria bacterium CG11_big_fil_rev_8_21_14_0_20_36_8]PIZ65208.1 MAG: DUF368 domain-containing protein [Candidatus Roizmanbacteria bacterium CG_4_10_14_0_2_um_filter_36_9]